jgi:hypothetical protein
VTGSQASIFISYSHEDKDLARALAAALDARGLRVWIDEGELKVGDSLIERIATAIAEIDFFLALVSEASRKSNWCRKELALAVTGELGREGVRVLPVRVAGAEMPDALADVLYLSLDEANIDEVADKIAAAIPQYQAEQRERVAKRREAERAARRPSSGTSTLPPTASAPPTADYEPIRITGIVEEVWVNRGMTEAQEARCTASRCGSRDDPTRFGRGASSKHGITRRDGRRCTAPALPLSLATPSSSTAPRWRSLSAITSRRCGTCSRR